MSGDQTTIASVSPTDARAKLRGIVDAFPGKRFAVIDGGHFEDLPALFKKTGLFARSLFLDTADVAVQAAGPWLVQLDQSPEATDAVFTLVGDKPAVVFWRCADGEMVLWRHLRGLNMARIPVWAANGDATAGCPGEVDVYETTMFRHWDPSVLGALMPVLDAAQFSRVVGRAEEIAFHTDDYGGCRRVRLGPDRPAASPGPLTVRSEQIESLNARRVFASEQRIAAFLKDALPDDIVRHQGAAFAKSVTAYCESAADFGLRSEQARARWAYLMFATDGKLLTSPGVEAYFRSPTADPEGRLLVFMKSLAVAETRLRGA